MWPCFDLLEPVASTSLNAQQADAALVPDAARTWHGLALSAIQAAQAVLRKSQGSKAVASAAVRNGSSLTVAVNEANSATPPVPKAVPWYNAQASGSTGQAVIHSQSQAETGVAGPQPQRAMRLFPQLVPSSTGEVRPSTPKPSFTFTFAFALPFPKSTCPVSAFCVQSQVWPCFDQLEPVASTSLKAQLIADSGRSALWGCKLDASKLYGMLIRGRTLCEQHGITRRLIPLIGNSILPGRSTR